MLSCSFNNNLFIYASSLYLKIYIALCNRHHLSLWFIYIQVKFLCRVWINFYKHMLMIHRIYLIYSVIDSTNMNLSYACEMPKFKSINLLYQVGRKKMLLEFTENDHIEIYWIFLFNCVNDYIILIHYELPYKFSLCYTNTWLHISFFMLILCQPSN